MGREKSRICSVIVVSDFKVGPLVLKGPFGRSGPERGDGSAHVLVGVDRRSIKRLNGWTDVF